jgi:hypothetical protein
MSRKSPDRAAADEALAKHGSESRDTSRNLPLPPDIAQALLVIAKRNGKTLKVALADLAASLDLKAGLQGLSARYRAEADAELGGLFGTHEEAGE